MHEIVSEYGQWEVQREEFTLSEGGKAIVEYNSNDIVERKEKQNALFSPQLKKSEPYIFRRKKKEKIWRAMTNPISNQIFLQYYLLIVDSIGKKTINFGEGQEYTTISQSNKL